MRKFADKEEKRSIFRKFLADHNLKSTTQRDFILDVFLSTERHVSTEELYRLVTKKNAKIGYATVHRTLKLLKACGLAMERQFGDGYIRYERAEKSEHHDHIICTNCGEILEFEEKEIERLQEDVARRHNYAIFRHRLELYGLCPRCRP